MVVSGFGLRKKFCTKLLGWSTGGLLNGSDCFDRVGEQFFDSKGQNGRNCEFLQLSVGVSPQLGGELGLRENFERNYSGGPLTAY